MSKYPPLSIKGYRQLTDDEIGLINSIKTHGDALAGQIESLLDTPGVSTRWVADGEHYLKLGLMCLCRAVARPEGF